MRRAPADGPPVTGGRLIRIRASELIAWSALEAAMEQSSAFVPGRPVAVIHQPVVIPPLVRPAGRPGRYVGPSFEHLRLAGLFWSLAHACGANELQVVGDKLGLTRSTAHRWVQQAQQRGLVPLLGGMEETNGDKQG